MALLKRKRAGLGDAMSVVTRFVNACNRHDADAVYACLHPDFDSIQPMFPTRNFRGADQVRRNWQAIFDAEPGFRLTVLRSAAVDDTVWLELHGAGRDAEVAGVFVMGIQGDRIRWARIYSGLVEPVPAAADAPVSQQGLHEVPVDDARPAASGNGEVVEEALIAPVVDIERSGRRRRRSLRRHAEPEAATPQPPETEAAAATTVAEPVTEAAEPAEPAEAPEAVTEPAEPAEAPEAVTELAEAPEPVIEAPEPVVEMAEPVIEMAEPPEPVIEMAEPALVPDEVAEPAPVPEEAAAEPITVTEEEPPSEPEAQVLVEPEPEAEVLVEPAADEAPVTDEAPETEAEPEAEPEATAAHDILSELEQEPEEEQAAEVAADEPPSGAGPKRRFGWRH